MKVEGRTSTVKMMRSAYCKIEGPKNKGAKMVTPRWELTQHGRLVNRLGKHTTVLHRFLHFCERLSVLVDLRRIEPFLTDLCRRIRVEHSHNYDASQFFVKICVRQQLKKSSTQRVIRIVTSTIRVSPFMDIFSSQYFSILFILLLIFCSILSKYCV